MVADGKTPTVAASEWLTAVDDLLLRASGSVHRPVLLLYLLGRAQRREPREVAFVDVELGIKKALQTMGSAKRADPLLPFWHMQSSPFWEVFGSDALPDRESTARPTRRALLQAKGALRAGWWAVLLGDDELVAKLGEQILIHLRPAGDEERAAAARLVGFKRA